MQIITNENRRYLDQIDLERFLIQHVQVLAQALGMSGPTLSRLFRCYQGQTGLCSRVGFELRFRKLLRRIHRLYDLNFPVMGWDLLLDEPSNVWFLVKFLSREVWP